MQIMALTGLRTDAQLKKKPDSSRKGSQPVMGALPTVESRSSEKERDTETGVDPDMLYLRSSFAYFFLF